MRTALRQFEGGNPAKLIEHINGAVVGVSGLLVHPILRREPEEGRITMSFNPPDLMHAMWLQFAQHACSGARLFRCQRCSAPFPVGSGTARRSSAKFCSNACKVAAFKDRQTNQLK
jgi:hypothetical protein